MAWTTFECAIRTGQFVKLGKSEILEYFLYSNSLGKYALTYELHGIFVLYVEKNSEKDRRFKISRAYRVRVYM